MVSTSHHKFTLHFFQKHYIMYANIGYLDKTLYFLYKIGFLKYNFSKKHDFIRNLQRWFH